MNIIHGFGVHMDIGGIQYTMASMIDNYGDYNRLRLTLGHQFHFGLHKIIGWQKLNDKPSQKGK
ncbi:hypothetical protein CJD36_015250 [Flavipsychrobacter stenotrophus]|uniref:Uncharacterized protein n=1 Tax=Flavipsychrobacter stenotrophus TaxID=2077091 RepID=A0A2S7ST08_9BACT|nr:hypothetical protein CJD36_015250 [Flavipsychrobacter stenotrophus]